MEKKNSIIERAKRSSPKAKDKVRVFKACIDGLYYLEMNDCVTDKQAKQIDKKIKKILTRK